MMKNAKKLISFALVCSMALSAAACGGKNDGSTGGTTPTNAPSASATDAPKATDAPQANNDAPPATQAAPETAPTTAETPAEPEPDLSALTKHERLPEMDFGGMEIVLGNWWSSYNTDTYEPLSASAEATLEWRKEIQERFNFKMSVKQIWGWEEVQEGTATSIMSGTPAADIIVLGPQWFLGLYGQGLFAPLDGHTVDFTSNEFVEWSKPTIESTTFGGRLYGMRAEATEPGIGLFFNKRLFEEAGLDPELPYDMQRDGTWTWDNFLDVCKRLTRDIDNDGIVDTYAITTFHKDMLTSVLFSNDAEYVGKDASGKFVNATGTPQFLECLQFMQRVYTDGWIQPQPEGSVWNYFVDAFYEGQGAMRAVGEYESQALSNMMDDDYGFVMFPRGPKAKDYAFGSADNVFVVPVTYTDDQVDKLTFAYMLWQMDPPDYDDPEAWKGAFYTKYRDARAVDETLTLMRDPAHISPDYVRFTTGIETGDIAYNIWYDDADPASLVESVQQSWDNTISENNKVAGY